MRKVLFNQQIVLERHITITHHSAKLALQQAGQQQQLCNSASHRC